MSIDFSTLQGLAIPEGVVTQIIDASGTVLWSIGSPTIKFTFEDTVYTITEGLTWEDVSASAFGTPNCILDWNGTPLFQCYDNTVTTTALGDNAYIVDSNNNAVAPTDAIVPNEVYTSKIKKY